MSHEVKVMGVLIGHAKSWIVEDTGEDVYLQADHFVPADNVRVPKADVISFHFPTGKYKTWDSDGKVIVEDDIFEAIKLS